MLKEKIVRPLGRCKHSLFDSFLNTLEGPCNERPKEFCTFEDVVHCPYQHYPD